MYWSASAIDWIRSSCLMTVTAGSRLAGETPILAGRRARTRPLPRRARIVAFRGPYSPAVAPGASVAAGGRRRGRTAHHQAEVQGLLVRHFGRVEDREQQLDGTRADLVHRLADGGQRRAQVARGGQVVETDDREVR